MEERQRPPEVDGLRVPDDVELLRRKGNGTDLEERQCGSDQPRSALPEEERRPAGRPGRCRSGAGAYDWREDLLQAGGRGAGEAGDAERGEGTALRSDRFHPAFECARIRLRDHVATQGEPDGFVRTEAWQRVHSVRGRGAGGVSVGST